MTLTLDQLGMRFGGKQLFQSVSIQLQAGAKYGLIGANGSGKSTLMSILMGEMEPDAGDVRKSKELKVGALNQDQFIHEKERILDVVLSGNVRLWQAMRRRLELVELSDPSEEQLHELAELEGVFAEEQGYRAEAEAGRLLDGLGIPAERHRDPISTLSGGYKLRVLLAQVFFGKPDVLLLDEPTNHLDIFSILWLGDYLKSYPGTLVVSSHHRDFLNRICTHMLDVDYGTVRVYKGNYDAFDVQKEEERSRREVELASQEQKRDHLQDFVDRFKYKASKARQAQSKAKMIEKLEEEMSGISLLPTSRRHPHLNFLPYRPSGAIPLKITEMGKSYGEKTVLKGVSLEVERGEKVAIIGPNGIGKSTLLEVVTGHVVSDSGEFEWGHGVKVGYFPQDHLREVDQTLSLIDWLEVQAPQLTHEKLRGVLGACLFSGDEVSQPISTLSGGEVARLILARLILLEPNVLVFDEPTNHLDMEAIESLVQAIQSYEGTVLVVSHNTYFLSRVANRIIEISHSGIRDYSMSFEEYAAKRDLSLQQDVSAQLTRLESTKAEKPSSSSGKDSYEERKKKRNRVKQLQRQIEQSENRSEIIEEKMAKIDLKLASPEFYTDRSHQEQNVVHEKKKSLEKELEETLAHWERSSEELERLESED